MMESSEHPLSSVENAIGYSKQGLLTDTKQPKKQRKNQKSSNRSIARSYQASTASWNKKMPNANKKVSLITTKINKHDFDILFNSKTG